MIRSGTNCSQFIEEAGQLLREDAAFEAADVLPSGLHGKLTG